MITEVHLVLWEFFDNRTLSSLIVHQTSVLVKTIW